MGVPLGIHVEIILDPSADEDSQRLFPARDLRLVAVQHHGSVNPGHTLAGKVDRRACETAALSRHYTAPPRRIEARDDRQPGSR
jgi:hypothetical protein